MQYLPRVIDNVLSEYLETFPAILIEGPKWCGKTTTAELHANSVLNFQDPDFRDTLLSTAEIKPSLLLQGEKPLLIDEWQEAPVIWDAIRHYVDKNYAEGIFILTGSNSIDDFKIKHSGTGRIARLEMSSMSLYESMESTGQVSLSAIFKEPSADIDGAKSKLTIEELIFAACRGGWPASLNKKSDRAKLLIAKDYLDTICRSDITKVDNVVRSEKYARLILRAYARNISTFATKSTMIKDIRAHVESFAEDTFNSYANALEKLFIISDVDGWCPAIRSASAIRRGAKREFSDPSLAVAALALTPELISLDLKTFGFIFECMCARDLRVYSQCVRGSLQYYHDRYGLEADFVLHLEDGKYALIECKLGSREINEGAEHLLQIKHLVREYNKKEKQVPLREPDLLIVLTGGVFAYTRPDGVKVIPLASLRP